jgi:pimeloyl-ACP methyl ester carboxylesterase
VFEDRQERRGRTIDLNVVVLPARRGPKAPDPLVFIPGGPGQAATQFIARSARSYHDVWQTRDLVFVDQRGTGRSNPLDCPWGGTDADLQSYFADFIPVAVVTACRERLASRADVRLYTSEAAADDLDDVRAALGYERLNIEGVSYGTRAALVYAQRHPARVRALVLNGLVPPSITIPLYYARDFDRALREVFAACARDVRCSRAYPSPAADLRRALATLDRGPVSVSVPHPATGASAVVNITRDVFAERLRSMLYTAWGARALPSVVGAAARGDFRPFVDRVLASRGGGGVSTGVWLTITCAEDVRRIDSSRVAGATRGTTLGAYRVRQQQAACAEWPVATLSPRFDAPKRLDVPALLVAGAWDPVTPPSWSDEAAKVLPRNRRIVVPHAAHGPGGACVDAIVGEFIRSADPEAVDGACLRALPAPVFVGARG